MLLTVTMSLSGLSSKANDLIDTVAFLNCESKEFVISNRLYKDCKIVPRFSIRVASERRISKTKCSRRVVLTTGGHEFTGLYFSFK